MNIGPKVETCAFHREYTTIIAEMSTHTHITTAKTQSGRTATISARSGARRSGTGTNTQAPVWSDAATKQSQCLAARASASAIGQTTGSVTEPEQSFPLVPPLAFSNTPQVDDGTTREPDTRRNTAPPPPRRQRTASRSSSSTSTITSRHPHQKHSHVAARATTSSTDSASKNTSVRRDRTLERKGMANATAASRTPVTPRDHVPRSVHPSVLKTSSLGSTAAPSSSPSLSSQVSHTIGAGDETEYWDYQHRLVEIFHWPSKVRVCMDQRRDLGHKCRECNKPFTTLGDPLTERRGARIAMRYHGECFSGFADPRSQPNASHVRGDCAGTQLPAAPRAKATTKMRASSHFAVPLARGRGGGVM